MSDDATSVDDVLADGETARRRDLAVYRARAATERACAACTALERVAELAPPLDAPLAGVATERFAAFDRAQVVLAADATHVDVALRPGGETNAGWQPARPWTHARLTRAEARTLLRMLAATLGDDAGGSDADE